MRAFVSVHVFETQELVNESLVISLVGEFAAILMVTFACLMNLVGRGSKGRPFHWILAFAMPFLSLLSSSSPSASAMASTVTG